jgi:hypothetical protein
MEKWMSDHDTVFLPSWQDFLSDAADFPANLQSEISNLQCLTGQVRSRAESGIEISDEIVGVFQPDRTAQQSLRGPSRWALDRGSMLYQALRPT